MVAYAEFAVTSNFSFLRGASHPEELVKRAQELGLAGLGLADCNSVAGLVRAHVAAKEIGLKFAPGARLVFADGTPDILAYPRDRAAWGRLTRLLTRGKRRAEKGHCILYRNDLLEFIEGLNLIVLPGRLGRPSFPGAGEPGAHNHARRDHGQIAVRESSAPAPHTAGTTKRKADADQELIGLLLQLREAAPRSIRLAASMLYRGDDQRRLARLAAIAAQAHVPLIAVGDVLYHVPERRALQDVVTCIREHMTLEAAGRRLEAHAERHLKGADEMARLFRAAPQAVEETLRFLEGCRFSLDELRYEYPDETRAGFATPQEALVAFTEDGARRRYPHGIPPKVRHALDHEFALIAELGYAPYFLTVHDIVRYARSLGILCQGRGSAANSAVCYCLGITEVDPARADLLFERFVSAERREPPDIDVDFEHERREEIIQYIYRRYGRERAGLAATVICYRGRSAVREVGKTFGLSADTVGALAGSLWGWSSEGVHANEVRRLGLDPSDPRLAKVLALSRELIGFPRHLSQHVGGFVITRGRLDEVIPIENAAMEDRTVVEWDKDDLDALGILKIDVLGLGMLSCLRRAFELMEKHYGEVLNPSSDLTHVSGHDEQKRSSRRYDLSTIPPEDPAVYRMLCRADSVGVFQVESRAQMSMLPRLKPKEFYDLVIEVAIVRPGPIQGDMVHPYLRRRQGLEKVVYPSPSPQHGPPDELKQVLGKTLGVPLFQEQAMRIAIVAAGFTPTEADKLRRAMATFRRVGTIKYFRDKLVEGMVARGYPRDFAERCFRQIEGFGEYGFPESHAASFALLVYASAWLKCHYPDVFACALLNSQPMGFYAPAQIVRDVLEHGVEVRAVDINHSCWDHTLEDGAPAGEHLHPRHADMKGDILSTHALRLGFRQIKGFSETDARTIERARGAGYDSIRDLWLRTGLAPAALERLARADAFRSLGLDRRKALWVIRALRRAGDKDDLPLFARGATPELEPDVALPPMRMGEHIVEDYRWLHLSLRAHPVSFLRRDLQTRGILRHECLGTIPSGRRVTVAGLVLVRQRPGSANGVIFMTLEDETAIANVIVWPQVFETYRPLVLGARLLAVTGRLQNEQGVIHVVADRLEDLTPLLRRLLDDDAGTTPPTHGHKVRHLFAEQNLPLFAAHFGSDIVRTDQHADAAHTCAAMPKGRNFR